ncbi:MAG TPA: MATE family efflux transporter [Candidatus Binatia bacterium]|nr:MATE family efflux transporter [Candidatus Binatia bacterium]
MSDREPAPLSPPEQADDAAERIGMTGLVAPPLAHPPSSTLTPQRRRRILALAIPIIGAMASQNVLNLVDTAMVGHLGDEALAGVGISAFLNFMAVSFVMGMSAGVQAMCARWRGAGRSGEIAIPLNGGLLMSAAICIPASLVLVALVPMLMAQMAPEQRVAELGTSYLSLRILGMTAVGMNFAFRGYWNAIDMSRLYMGTLLFMHAINIFLNWILIFGNLGAPALGVAGAGMSNLISVYLGSACYFVLAWKHGRSAGFLSGMPSREVMRAMLSTSLPAGLQQLLFASGMVGLFWILSRLGTAEVAAGNVLINVMLVTILPSIGFGLAAATLVGQALGARELEEAKAWAWHVGRIAMAVVAVVSLPAVIAPELVLSPFLHDAETLALAAGPLRVAALSAPFESLGAVLMNAHLGAGSSRRVLAISVLTQWGLFLPAAYLLGPVLGLGILAIWVAQIAYRLVSIMIFAWSWRQGSWAEVDL